MGMDSADSHHTTNSMVLDPGGATYLSDGVFHRTQVETADGPVRNEDACIYRFEPRTGRFERYAPYGFANPARPRLRLLGQRPDHRRHRQQHLFRPRLQRAYRLPRASMTAMKEFWARPSRPCPGTGILTSRHFPAGIPGQFPQLQRDRLPGNLSREGDGRGSGLKGETLEQLVSSDDKNFRPSSVNVGPDGALYFLDWSNAIIGHLQHHLRDPNRDHEHGRIYRITYEGRPAA